MPRTAIVFLACSLAPVFAQQGEDRRRHDLDVLMNVLLPSRTPANGRINATDGVWEDWVRRTGELPPDFASMPSIPELPDPLDMQIGRAHV